MSKIKNIGLSVILVGLFLMLSAVGILAQPKTDAVPQAKGSYTPHDPIFIDHNANFTIANGVTDGSGTKGDPWIISGWEINVTAVGTGIFINFTTDYFIIRDCRIFSFSNNMSNGTKLSNVNNGVITNNVFTGTYLGIWLFWSNNIFISGNEISFQGHDGIRVGYSEYNTIINNKIFNNTMGIDINCQSCHNTVTYNNISYTGFYGVILTTFCDYNRIHHNDFVNNSMYGSVGSKQANDTSGKNFWNTSTEGNYWHEWTNPDTSPQDGIVDIPYAIDGGTGANDTKPLVHSVPVPQFPIAGAFLGAIAMACIFVAAYVMAGRRARKPE